jgi:hypothetical protein
MKSLLLSMAILVGLVGPASAQCGPNGCPAVPAPAYTWQSFRAGDPDLALFAGSVQIGMWRARDQQFFAYDPLAKVWAARPSTPPIPVPRDQLTQTKKCPCGCSCKAESCNCAKGLPCSHDCSCGPTGPLTGVVTEKIHQGVTSLNGRPITKDRAIAALGAPVPADAHLVRVTVIGPPEKRARVLQDLTSSPELAALRSQFLVHEYAPEEWPLQCGFRYGGDVTVYCQSPDGKVLHRQDDYKDGIKGLVLAIPQALRVANPNYDPSKDPDLRAPVAPQPAPSPPDDPWALFKKNPLLVAVGAILAYLLFRKKS